MKEFFENLKKIRNQKGIELEEIARKTKLPIHYLESIENGELENLPQGYDRIFFKRYLKEIDEDREEVWQDFNLFFGKGASEEYQAVSTDHNKEEPEGLESEEVPGDVKEKSSFLQDFTLRFNMDKLHLYFWIAVTIIVIGVVGYFAYQQFMFVQNNSLQVKEISIAEQIEEMQNQDSLLTPQMTRNTVIGEEVSGAVNVELRAVERTWIREVRDLRDTTDYIMPAGLSRDITANSSVQLMLGRADGVEVWLNGKNLGLMGDKNEVVVRLMLNREGIAEKRVKEVSPNQTTETDTSKRASTQGLEMDTTDTDTLRGI